MTRRELSQIYWLNKELKMWEEKKHDYESRAYPPSGTGDGVHGSGTSDRTGNVASEIADVTQIIDGILAQIQYRIREVYEHIDTIEDSQLRQIVQYRCVDCMNWEDVGDNTGITSDAAKKIFYRAYPE